MSEYPMPLDKLIPALIRFQSECPLIPKDKENPFFRNKDTGKKAMYADLATILDTTKEARTKNGLAVTQTLSGCSLITYLFHESGQRLISEMSLTKEPKNPQSFGSELTYARRYALSAILGIAAEDDDDGNSASQNNAAKSSTANTNVGSGTNAQQDKNKAAMGQVDCKTGNDNKPLTFKKKQEDGTFTFASIAELSNKQIEWYAKQSANPEQQQVASDYILNNLERFPSKKELDVEPNTGETA